MKHYFRRLLCGTIGSIITVVAICAIYGILRFFGWLCSLLPDTLMTPQKLDAFSVMVTIACCIGFSLIAVLVEWIWKNRIRKRMREKHKQNDDDEDD